MFFLSECILTSNLKTQTILHSLNQSLQFSRSSDQLLKVGTLQVKRELQKEEEEEEVGKSIWSLLFCFSVN